MGWNLIQAKAIQVEATDAVNFKWFGETETGGTVILISRGDTLFGHIATPTKRYNLMGLGRKLSALAEIDPSASPAADCSPPKPTGKAREATKSANASGRMGPQPCVNPIRVLVLSTEAARVLDPNIQQTAQIAVAQFNSAVYASQIPPGAVLQYAGYMPINFEETGNFVADLEELSQRTVYVSTLRQMYKADIVVLLAYNSYPARGSVITIESNRADAYAIAQVGSAANDYTLAHEVGHIFGGVHEESTAGSSYAQGKRFDVHRWPFVYRYSTLMHTWPAGINYSRVVRFSNPNVTYDGVSTGDAATANVARKINERTAAVADFEPAPDILSVYIDPNGPTAVNYGQVATWQPIYSCGSGPYTFQWSQSYDGFDYYPLTTNESYTGTLQYSTTYLRVIVTSGDGQVSSNYITVSVNGGGSGSRIAATTSENVAGLEVIYPNPSDEQAQVRYSLGAACPVSFEVVNQVGQTMRVYKAGLQQAGQHSYPINTSDLTEGKYTLKMAAADVVQSRHLLIMRKK